MKKVGIYSGIFDPVHKGHLAFAKEALNTLDIVYFLPEKTPRRKSGCAPYEDRVEMLELATANLKGLHVLKISDQEQYTVAETLPRLQKIFMGEELYLMMGSDQFEYLSTWPGAKQLADAVQFIIGCRDECQPEDLTRLAKKMPTLPQYSTVRTAEQYTSSSSIRAALKEGQAVDLPQAVLEYIQTKGLYQPVY